MTQDMTEEKASSARDEGLKMQTELFGEQR